LQTTTEFKQAYWDSNGSMPMSFFAATTYDTVWTIALTLRTAIGQWQSANKTVPRLHAMNYTDLKPLRETYIDIIQNSHFDGVSVSKAVEWYNYRVNQEHSLHIE
jgi:hypothetical protein